MTDQVGPAMRRRLPARRLRRVIWVVAVNPCERYYIPKDMHFNERGLQAYGLAVARYLSTAIPGD
jgi:hypothetical protein